MQLRRIWLPKATAVYVIDLARRLTTTGPTTPKTTGCKVRLAVLPYRKFPKHLQRIKTSGANLPAEVCKVEMVALTMLGIGSALGVRFRIFVLLPVILLGFLVCTGFGLTQGITIWSIMLTNVVGATCLQIGYLVGALLKFLTCTGRLDGTRSSQSARPFAG
jgi:hypothetical protein